MSTQIVDPAVTEAPGAAHEVEVRRRGWLAGVVGVAGCLVALAWLGRALEGGALLDWAVCAVTGALGVVHLLALLDARAPLLVADDLGVRVRRGREWAGVPWDRLVEVEVRHRGGALHDGALVLHHADGPEQDLQVPLSLTTTVRGAEDLADALRDLGGDDLDVVEVEAPPRPDARVRLARLAWPVRDDEAHDGTDATDDDTDDTVDDSDGRGVAAGPVRPVVASATPLPLRDPRDGARADVVLGAAALRLDPAETDDGSDGTAGAERGPGLPEGRALRREGSVDLVDDTVSWGRRVSPIARPGEAVTPLVIDDFSAPATDPVIGPELAAARTRLALSVDQLAERTRIRPHVIESIEVDDFTPCGGDFYARGHLRTLARVLGVDAAPLLAAYDEQYADAPIDPRRVFEAELATGAGGTIRGTRGGPNWSLLVAVVMTVVLVWSVVRLVTHDAVEVGGPAVRLNSSGGVDNGVRDGAGATVPVVLNAAGGGSQVIVRSGSQVVFDDQLAFMQTVQLDVAPPIRIDSTDGGLLVTVDGVDQGPLGETGRRAQDIFVP